jgi:hypothetical protein
VDLAVKIGASCTAVVVFVLFAMAYARWLRSRWNDSRDNFALHLIGSLIAVILVSDLMVAALLAVIGRS